ncbi:MAG: diheme cytochrome c [Magnetospirillum sp.]|nr:diheme cytochrome c [Magnetospirillum sp.]
MRIRKIITALTLAALIGTEGLASAARAEDDRVPPVTHELTRSECGQCHMAFQPAFLPARSWNAIMDGLGDHFGEDASLRPEKAKSIRDYLVANAGGGARPSFLRRLAADAAPLRITETPAFLRKHRFADSVWTKPGIVSKSNCAACHQGAEAGVYEDEDD